MTDSDASGAGTDPQALATGPAATLFTLYQGIGQALATAAHSAVNAQQQAYVTAVAAVTEGVATLYALDTAALGGTVKKELDE